MIKSSIPAQIIAAINHGFSFLFIFVTSYSFNHYPPRITEVRFILIGENALKHKVHKSFFRPLKAPPALVRIGSVCFQFGEIASVLGIKYSVGFYFCLFKDAVVYLFCYPIQIIFAAIALFNCVAVILLI